MPLNKVKGKMITRVAVLSASSEMAVALHNILGVVQSCM